MSSLVSPGVISPGAASVRGGRPSEASHLRTVSLDVARLAAAEATFLTSRIGSPTRAAYRASVVVAVVRTSFSGVGTTNIG